MVEYLQGDMEEVAAGAEEVQAVVEEAVVMIKNHLTNHEFNAIIATGMTIISMNAQIKRRR
jgi:hypothetical protein